MAGETIYFAATFDYEDGSQAEYGLARTERGYQWCTSGGEPISEPTPWPSTALAWMMQQALEWKRVQADPAIERVTWTGDDADLCHGLAFFMQAPETWNDPIGAIAGTNPLLGLLLAECLERQAQGSGRRPDTALSHFATQALDYASAALAARPQ